MGGEGFRRRGEADRRCNVAGATPLLAAACLANQLQQNSDPMQSVSSGRTGKRFIAVQHLGLSLA